MKSIKQQYIDLKEGRMSQQNFMRNLRMTMPQYVTNVTSYGDAVKILRNKGILNESLIKQLEKGIEVEKEHTKDEIKAAKIALDHLKEDDKYYDKLKKAGLEEDMDSIDATMSAAEELAKQMGDYDSAVVALQDEMGLSINQAETIASQVFPGLEEDYNEEEAEEDYDEEGAEEDERIDNMINQRLEDEAEEKEKINAMIKKYEDEESGKYTTGGEQFPIKEAKSKWENTSGKSMYAQFKEIDNLNGQEVLIGIDFEIEKNHELSKLDAIKLVIKNLKKNPVYYTATLMAGKEMTEIPTIGKFKPGSDKMRPVKGEDSLVDKDNGMKPVKDVEKVKASANKAKKETNKAAGTISLMSLVAKASRGIQKMDATGEKMKVVKEDLERDFDPNVEGEPSQAFKQFVSQKKGEEAAAASAAETHGGFKRGDKVMIDPEAAQATGLKAGKIYNITNFRVYKGGSMLQNVDALLDNGEEINVDYLIKAPKLFTSSTDLGSSFSKLTKDDLMEMIREELKEYFDGRDNLTDTAGHQLDEERIQWTPPTSFSSPDEDSAALRYKSNPYSKVTRGLQAFKYPFNSETEDSIDERRMYPFTAAIQIASILPDNYTENDLKNALEKYIKHFDIDREVADFFVKKMPNFWKELDDEVKKVMKRGKLPPPEKGSILVGLGDLGGGI